MVLGLALLFPAPASASGLVLQRSAQRHYECTNHIGNVQQVLADKVTLSGSTASNQVQHVAVLANSDYRPFGSKLQGRSSSSPYRFAYQSSEADDEIAGVEGAHITTLWRHNDTRIARWWSLDVATNPSWSPYNSMQNNPVWHNDPLGDKIRSDRIDRKKSKEERKLTEKANVREHENMLAASLSEKTGLTLSFDDDGYLSYEKDSEGNPIVSGGSEAARSDLLQAIDDTGFEYDLGWENGSAEVNGGQSSDLDDNEWAGWVKLDAADFSPNDPAEADIGMVFLHELNHGYFGREDNFTRAETAIRGKSEMYQGTGIHKLGTVGETVDRVNKYREQLGYPERATYETIDGEA